MLQEAGLLLICMSGNVEWLVEGESPFSWWCWARFLAGAFEVHSTGW
jgi:hypothetical protein